MGVTFSLSPPFLPFLFMLVGLEGMLHQAMATVGAGGGPRVYVNFVWMRSNTEWACGFPGGGTDEKAPKQGALLPLVGCGPPSVDEKMVPPFEDQVPTTVGSSPRPSQLGWASLDGVGVPRAITYLPNPTLPHTPLFPKAILKGVSVVVVGCSGVVGVRCGGE